MPGDVTLWPNLTGGEAIDLLGRLRGGLDEQRRAELLERFELDPTKKGRAYSKGNRQKVALVAALASDVELLILDEPTSGLDPLMEAVFQACVRRGARRGPHRAALQPHPGRGRGAVRPREIIRAGRTVETGTLDELRHLTRTTIDRRDRRAARARRHPGVHDARSTARACAARSTRALETACAADRPGVRSLSSQPPTLEELFLRHYASARDRRSPAALAAAGAASATG